MNESTSNTVTITVPATLDVSGTYRTKRTLDMTALTPETLAGIVNYWFGVMTQRVASGAPMEERKVAINQLADKLVNFDWTPGAGGGGGSLSIEARAERRFLSGLCIDKLGMKTTEAAKKAKTKDAMYQVFLSMLCNANNTGKVPADKVNAFITENQGWIESQIDLQVRAIMEEERMEAEMRKAAKKATSGLDLTMLG